MAIIESVAMSELTRAFAGLRIKLSNSRDARYRVRVVQNLRDLRARRESGIAGQSHAISGFGGSGAVNFELLASNAIGYAPAGADRTTMIAGIGRGIGRTAVHEFTHQLLPKVAIDASRNVRSYEYPAASRAE